jgi:hypothetical protein
MTPFTVRSGVSRSAVFWSQPTEHAPCFTASANAYDHDAPGPATPAGATLRSSCCTFHNRIGTRPAAALHLVVLSLSLQLFAYASALAS